MEYKRPRGRYFFRYPVMPSGPGKTTHVVPRTRTPNCAILVPTTQLQVDLMHGNKWHGKIVAKVDDIRPLDGGLIWTVSSRRRPRH